MWRSCEEDLEKQSKDMEKQIWVEDLGIVEKLWRCKAAKFRKLFHEEKEVYKKLKMVVDRVLASSSYSEVNLAKLFQAFTSLK
ncbi:DNA polymerase alpha catalytic subunit [Silurus meridionalis]|nr:DNA polymerase alpha catalytic subunit [Silurus meridionalis]